ncbi:hypothetical protein [Isosphaera pallida]|uniref:hypothetical protein n=1 Tax=Isosphaera pallida TaxID=128 RepID=UPI0002E652AA|nr:hypothetical protein [Isosphaera pallida]
MELLSGAGRFPATSSILRPSGQPCKDKANPSESLELKGAEPVLLPPGGDARREGQADFGPWRKLILDQQR